MFFFCLMKACLWYLQVDPASAGAQYDREFIVCSLDLLSGLAEGLGSGIESLVLTFLDVLLERFSVHKFPETTAYIALFQVSQTNLRDLLLNCCMDEAPDVRQSAFALMGDLARVSCIFFYIKQCPLT